MGLLGLVLAGGVSGRFVKSGGVYKGLVGVGGKSLACIPLASLFKAGVEEVLVVTGPWSWGFIEAALSFCPRTAGVRVIHFYGSLAGNGATLIGGLWELLGKVDYVVVSMIDHIYPSSVPERLAGECRWRAEACIAVDPEPRFIDVGEATHVAVRGSRVVRVGKGLTTGLVDMGVHLYSARVAGYWRCLNRDASLNGFVNCIIDEGVNVEAVFFPGAPWAELDSLDDVERLLGRHGMEIQGVIRGWA